MTTSLGQGLSISPMLSSPCHVPDTLFYLIFPGFSEVSENLAPERPGQLLEFRSGRMWASRSSDSLGPGVWKQGSTGTLAHPTFPPQGHGALI